MHKIIVKTSVAPLRKTCQNYSKCHCRNYTSCVQNIIPHSLGTAVLLWWVAKRTGTTVGRARRQLHVKDWNRQPVDLEVKRSGLASLSSIVRLADCWRWHSRSINEGRQDKRKWQAIGLDGVSLKGKGASKLAISSNFVHLLVGSVSIPASPKTALTSFFIFRSKSAKLKHCFTG